MCTKKNFVRNSYTKKMSLQTIPAELQKTIAGHLTLSELRRMPDLPGIQMEANERQRRNGIAALRLPPELFAKLELSDDDVKALEAANGKIKNRDSILRFGSDQRPVHVQHVRRLYEDPAAERPVAPMQGTLELPYQTYDTEFFYKVIGDSETTFGTVLELAYLDSEEYESYCTALNPTRYDVSDYEGELERVDEPVMPLRMPTISEAIDDVAFYAPRNLDWFIREALEIGDVENSSMCVRRVDIRYDGSGRTNEIAREFKDVPGILGPLYVTVCYQHEDGKEYPVKVTDADMAAALERVHAAANVIAFEDLALSQGQFHTRP